MSKSICYRILALVMLMCAVVSCSKDEVKNPPLSEFQELTPGDEVTDAEMKNYYINVFAANMMNLYYLWIDEPQVDAKVEAWNLFADPVASIKDIRYKKPDGTDIDRWTMMIDNYEEHVSSLDGVEKTYGFDFQLYGWDDTSICAVVTYVMKGGPAEKAGWKRGDIIVKVNGKSMLKADNKYVDIVYNELLAGSTLNATMATGEERTLNSVVLQEDAVLFTKVFDCSGKKVGYMVFNSFTFESIDRLIEECKEFKSAGIDELILDLRYNGGGYGLTMQALSSMLAPETEVKAGSLLETEVYNKTLSEYYKKKGISNETHFTTQFSRKSDGVEKKWNTSDANIGIKNLYVIITGSSASASESLICCLKPYLPITLVGEQSYGKYCGGYVLGAQDFYDDYKDQSPIKDIYDAAYPAVKDWGIYVMVSRYADKDGVTGCMPDGFAPDVEATDVPYDGHQFGDPEESMLKVALTKAGYQYPASARAQVNRLDEVEQVRKPTFGMLVNTMRNE